MIQCSLGSPCKENNVRDLLVVDEGNQLVPGFKLQGITYKCVQKCEKSVVEVLLRIHERISLDILRVLKDVHIFKPELDIAKIYKEVQLL